MQKVFLSHSSADKVFTKRLAADLKKCGIKVWYADWELNIGDSLFKKIEAGIKESSWLIIVLSPDSVKSNWVKLELNAGLAIELAQQSVFILPVLCRDCEMPLFLQHKLYADFRRDYNNGLQSLLNRIVPKRKEASRNVRLESDYKQRVNMVTNRRKIWLSGMLHVFMDRHDAKYSHDDWLQLLRDIEKRGLVPYDTVEVGKLLERIKEQWLINEKRYATDFSRSIEWIFPAHSISQVMPVVNNNDIFWGATDYRAYRINLEDGSTIWETKLDAELRDCSIYYASNLKRVFAVTQKGTIFCLNYDDGEIIWYSRAVRKFFGQFSYDKIAANDKLILVSENYPKKKIYIFDSIFGEYIAEAQCPEEVVSKLKPKYRDSVERLFSIFLSRKKIYNWENKLFKVSIKKNILKILNKNNTKLVICNIKEMHYKINPSDGEHCGLCQGGGMLLGNSLIFSSGRLLINLNIKDAFWEHFILEKERENNVR